MQKKKGSPLPTAKNGFHIPNLHPKKYISYLKKKKKKKKKQFTRKIP